MMNHNQVTDSIVNQVPNRIVITGGPLAGKSTILKHLQNIYGDKARFMTEVASMLLMNGYPKPGNDVAFSEEWLNYINDTILPTQLAMENGHLHAAAENKKRAVFFDRGLLDPSAYLPDGYLTMVDRYGVNMDDVLSRYSMVIHMQSLACHSKKQYKELCATNPARYDTADMAIARDAALIEAWKGHPNWVFVPAKATMDEKLQIILTALHPFMNVEIERKFRLNTVPEHILKKYPSKTICQYYISRNEYFEMRVRSYDDSQFEICIKDNDYMSRMEWETPLPVGVFNAIISSDWPQVRKRRYYIPHGPNTLELDVYLHPSLAGLYILECEFENELEAKNFVLPSWAADAEEVTGIRRYKNALMACLP